ncbi:DUF397 domain-containing protein [Streptomyces sp. NPDC048603]|uniref:DUF397 domain-containing protein n=1 Tax=Streptomyces sp. NPDC048603 TaxID=3365577 RepID=UPI003712A3B5
MNGKPELEWFKSSYSSSSDINDCIEVATTVAAVLVRDSKDTAIPHLNFSPAAWGSFVTAARRA